MPTQTPYPPSVRFLMLGLALAVLLCPLTAYGWSNSIRSIPTKTVEPIVLKNESGLTIRAKEIESDRSIRLENCQDITIISCSVRSIELSGCSDIRIYNNYIKDSERNGIGIDECSGVFIQGNRIERVASGVYAHKSTGIQVIGNFVRDVQGPMPRGQLVQFDKVTGPDNLILANFAINYRGESTPEDMINLYQSVGTAESPIRVEKNYLMGDPDQGSTDMSDSGSGIMLGDGGGSHQLCLDNTLINCGQVGIGVAGGGNITVTRNIIYGTLSNIANVGLYVWNQYKDKPAGPITVTDNRVTWVNSKGQSNHFWEGGGFPKVTKASNEFGDDSLPEQLPEPPTTPQSGIPPVPHGKIAEYPFFIPN